MKRMIVGMSKSRSDLGSWIEDHTWPVMVALAQLYLFPHGPRVHWRKEVWEKFDRMHLFKHNNKLPDAKFILCNSWEVNRKFVADSIQYAIDKEENYSPRNDIDVHELSTIMEAYFTWVASKLCNHVALQKDEVLSKLDELGLTEHVQYQLC